MCVSPAVIAAALVSPVTATGVDGVGGGAVAELAGGVVAPAFGGAGGQETAGVPPPA